MAFLLHIDQPLALQEYLKGKHWLMQDEEIEALSVPGAGNMNYVLRVKTNKKSLIIKQAKEYVEKYPFVPAPSNRAIVEAHFYANIRPNTSIAAYMPALIASDKENHILLLEDLGHNMDYSYLYHGQHHILQDEVSSLVQYLNQLHSWQTNDKAEPIFANREMRILNHEHIFVYPFVIDNGFDLNTITEGLQEIAQTYKTNVTLKSALKVLGEVYLSDGEYLLHGDYYPGSWLKTNKGVRVIDPEFCHYGRREFELGVMHAHLILSQQDASLIQLIKAEYIHFAELDEHLLQQFTGVEMMRRLIGLAQLPLHMNLQIKSDLLEQAKKYILS